MWGFMTLTVIVFTSITTVINQNFTGKILVCFIQPIQTSPDFIFLLIRGMFVLTNHCTSKGLRMMMKARYSASLPEPFEIALQCLQFEKKVFVWKSMRTLGAILNLTEALSQIEHFMCTCGLTDLIHTCSVCSAYAVRVRYVWCSEAARTHCAFTQYAFAVCYWSAAVYHKHNIYPLF